MAGPTSTRAAIAAAALLWSIAPAQGPACVVHAIDGRVVSGGVALEGDRLTVQPKSGDAVVFSIADLVSVEVESARPAPAATDMFVWLRSGSSMPATGIDGATADGHSIRITTPSGASIDVPLHAIDAIRCRKNEPHTFAGDRREPDANNDYLYVVSDGTPKRFSVTVASVREGKAWFQLRGKDYSFPLTGDDSVAAIVFGKNTGFAPDRQKKPRVKAILRAGEEVEGKLIALGDKLTVRLDEGVAFTTAADRLVRLEVLSDKLTWLGALTPEVHQTPAFDRTWPWTVDRSPAGPGILLGGEEHSRGLVLVPRTRLTYATNGNFDAFEATIGIDDRAGPQAHAEFRILGDGKILYESPPMTLGSKPLKVHVDLQKCRSFAIEADFGKNFDLGDLCAFADARLLQQ